MRAIALLTCLLSLTACVTDDAITNRQHGQQLVCHKGRTQAVPTTAVYGHQGHGDTLGPCP